MLVLVLIVLEIPLLLSLSDPASTPEVKAQAAAQAQGVAAAASLRLDDRAQLDRLVGRAGRDLGARVIVVDARGRLLADSWPRIVSHRGASNRRAGSDGRAAGLSGPLGLAPEQAIWGTLLSVK